jgi:hypothetical protein
MGFYIPWLIDASRTAVAGTAMSVYVQPGWESRGHGGMRCTEVVVGHHTATADSAPGDYPSLNVVTYGRSDLPGPLAQLGLGRGGHIYVIAAGLSYHAGASAYAGYTDLNDEAIGIEAESAGNGLWTPEQSFMYPRLVAALCLYMSRDVSRYCSHRTCATPAGRKPDPKGIADDWMQQQAAAVLAAGFATEQRTGSRDDMVITCGAPNRCALLSGGTLVDISDDAGARDCAQAAIEKSVLAEIKVTEATWNRMAHASRVPMSQA